jgi:hypothetical protein
MHSLASPSLALPRGGEMTIDHIRMPDFAPSAHPTFPF